MLRKYLADNTTQSTSANIPLNYIGPLKLRGDVNEDGILVPLATYESPLWPSVERGFRVAAKSGGIGVFHQGQAMVRSFILNAPDACKALEYKKEILSLSFDDNIAQTSRFAKFRDLTVETVGRHIFVRLSLFTGDAAGHNMVTKAASAIIEHLLDKYDGLEYGSVSGNMCTDKKVSAINAMKGRGHNVVASLSIPPDICKRMLRTDPETMKELNVQKNMIGSVMAGSLRSANAHVANMLLAFYLATGQDAANIVEGSQAITQCDVLKDGSLEISCHIPNLILGTVGNGKGLPHVEEAFKNLGCMPNEDMPGESSARLAMICAATCLAGELSLLAAQTNEGELIHSHEVLERGSKNR